ncbi:MAG TPA: DUF1223 domain-containing protein [Burkholderiales bacterium]|nr:DUF1223 domain-containing protein [Burkholderiales bacterium]
MRSRLAIHSLAVLAACTLAAPAMAWQCTARSQSRTTALVELYTSEGCSSCPRADRWLSTLGRPGAAGSVVPLALHVDYWDDLGWRDPFAGHGFSLRQRALAALAHASFVYTPQVLLQGRDFRAWGSAAFDLQLARINVQPAKAAIRLSLTQARQDALLVDAHAVLAGVREASGAALYLASYENRLVSRVRRGENEGRTLTHDYVVVDLAGPFDFGTDRRVAARRELALRPGAAASNAGVAAFVQDQRSAEVLQALMLSACPGR